MEEEREKTIDRFDLVRTYQNAESKEDFLYMLLNLEAVQAQSSMVSYIREVLHCMKQYARQHTLAVIKGIVSSVFPGKKENSGEVYERWEDTLEFAKQMDSLWRALGIDFEVYSDRDVLRKQEELSAFLKEQDYGDEAVSRMEYDQNTGIFSIPGERTEETDAAHREKLCFIVLSKADYERLTAYAKENREQGEQDPEPVGDAFDRQLLSGEIIVAADSRIVRQFLSEFGEAGMEKDDSESPEEETEEREETQGREKSDHDDMSVETFSDWLDRISASREKCAAMGFERTAAAAGHLLMEYGLEKKDGKWVQVLASEDGTIREKPLTEELVLGIDRDMEARTLNLSYQREALERTEKQDRQEKEVVNEQSIQTGRKRADIDR